MKLLFAHTKGGTGHSTGAEQAAAWAAHQKLDPIAVDLDPQKTLMSWCQRRSQLDVPLVPVAYLEKDVIASTVQDLSRRYGVVVMDAPGHAGDVLLAAASVADKWLIPVRPGIADLEALNDVLAILKKARVVNPGLQAEIVLNFVSTHPFNREAQEAREAILASFPELPINAQVIRERKIYRDAAKAGASVLESNSPARAEIQLLAQSIFNI
ncbi:division plane positioning ATPase MipZ [Quatrionicoccus australiensis]|uniref:division plane positioning ATPase MipZ n=1 Tax=Quatrionicoccus australiensis TaxID=138118 RepID=UPI001CF9D833|nr:division plane positioning ATPase MipZ [Quatrionicoccus australiensis]MCB4359559.1 hypothetical protein [Quatrionicoccus australiensis]